MKYNLDKFYKSGRQTTIDKYFGGKEYSTPDFNERVLNLWKNDINVRKQQIIWGVIIPSIISLAIGALYLILGILW